MRYESDLTTKQWNMIKPLFEAENRGKHLRVHSKRKLVNAVLYINKTGCQWRLLPHDFPKHTTVSSFYQRAVKSGLWEKSLINWYNLLKYYEITTKSAENMTIISHLHTLLKRF